LALTSFKLGRRLSIWSERGFGLVFAAFFALLGALSVVCCYTRSFKDILRRGR
jgi:hypothetical protein